MDHARKVAAGYRFFGIVKV